MVTNDRIIALRELMHRENIDACIVTSSDSHGSEYPSTYWHLREYLSGFNGSAGTLVVTRNHAGLWTDSRYYIQAEAQLRGSCIELHKEGLPGVPDPIEYLTYLLPSGAVVGVDGLTVSAADFRRWDSTLSMFGIKLRGDIGLVETYMTGIGEMSALSVWQHDVKFTGMSRKEKLALVRKKMEAQHVTRYIIASLDDVAWLTNLRGNEVEYNPVFYAYMIIDTDEATLYINPNKLTEADGAALMADGIKISLYESFLRDIKLTPTDAKVFYDPKRLNSLCAAGIPKRCVRIEGDSMILMLKGCKSQHEIEQIKNAHVRDGVALVKFARWIKENVKKERITELDASEKLTNLRKEGENYISDSFENIIAWGPNAAIVHYRPTIESNTVIEPRGLLLVDSGAQYYDGTTDVTRTFAMGEVTDIESLHYTLVLKAHIALATAIFPEGTKGIQLDSLARSCMWRYGVDYGHGTGHGVGFCLNVHEGPQSISKKGIDVAMEAGMLTSDEPGVYVEGSHGIRTESLVVCREAKQTGFGRFFAFETVTMMPIDKEPIKVNLLTDAEIKWVDEYHAKVYSALSGFLEGADLEWLKEACAPLCRE